MSFAGLLVHPLAIVTPAAAAPASDDEYGQPVAGDPDIDLVWGMVQPKTAREMAQTNQAGAEYSDHTIYLLPRRIAGSAWIRDADADGILDGGRRFDVVGVRSFEFGSAPHLELDVKLVGSTEGPTVPGS